MAPTAVTVAQFLGRGNDQVLLALAQEHLPIVTAFVQAYTRDRGFDIVGEPSPDIAAVIVSACARLVTNPAQSSFEQVGPFTSRPAVLEGFTLPELAVLHRYRRRAA